MVNLSVVFIHIATNVIVVIIMVGLVHTRALNLASAHNTRDPPRIAQGNKRPAVGVSEETNTWRQKLKLSSVSNSHSQYQNLLLLGPV